MRFYANLDDHTYAFFFYPLPPDPGPETYDGSRTTES